MAGLFSSDTASAPNVDAEFGTWTCTNVLCKNFEHKGQEARRLTPVAAPGQEDVVLLATTIRCAQCGHTSGVKAL